MLTAKKLWPPLSSILQRRALTSCSTTCHFPSTYQPSHHLPDSYPLNPFPSSSTTTTTVAALSYHFLGYPFKISGYCFCSESPNNTNTTRCWNCNAEPQAAPFLVCDDCRTIQPVDHSVNYFQIFGLDRKYEMEDWNLERKYKDWQKKLHPDLVHSKSAKEREFAAEQSARVIDAYRTLSNSLARAIYIMKLEGVDVNEEETISEPELLSEIMEIREAVEEAPDSQALNGIRSLMQEKLQHCSNSFANAFRSLKFKEAITCIRRMTYYDRVNEEIVKRL